MGIIWSLFGYDTGRIDDPDPTTGLTSREKFHIRTSWAKIMKNPTESGVALLLLYFKKHPYSKELFSFKNIPDEELPKSVQFKAHCNSVIHTVASIIDSLDSTDLLVIIIERIGTTHKPRNVTPKLFMELKETMLELFSSIMKKEEIEAWEKASQVVFTVIINGLNKQ
ncbi:globin-like [Diorhabda carinulata]|uniref:globin-like n=1 Tax=Diorhabda carinulata TaxID=1163345 RepID=UPI0024E14C34|nr:globin isoform X2 [Diorhabda sublineata]XP_056639328.1 globin isoform X2 [Diorhabda sublineata]XP_056639329.1 globin isoform X2 [Diorhabda sublineata]XP_056639330.1 globin isoform X2 [Diorhabda sublineata]XP_057656658.1 globin-like [Diorhabda carinulata]XP_057656659.1 globin-like [Diorhabda carinulata]XP_057656660.1 globin-like [Diorhabda carinulata]XP_057656662.1 globin-like [Diorhabda carinulata]XP_057656663.1 globin-like [Diorhabda carinulata]XP_057656664.1 globin-like [Diorhabda car